MQTTDLRPSDLIDIMRSCVGQDSATDFGSEGVLDTSFDDLDFDSLALVELTTVIEERCGVAVPDDAIDHMQTPRDALDYINGLLAGASAASLPGSD